MVFMDCVSDLFVLPCLCDFCVYLLQFLLQTSHLIAKFVDVSRGWKALDGARRRVGGGVEASREVLVGLDRMPLAVVGLHHGSGIRSGHASRSDRLKAAVESLRRSDFFGDMDVFAVFVHSDAHASQRQGGRSAGGGQRRLGSARHFIAARIQMAANEEGVQLAFETLVVPGGLRGCVELLRNG